MPIIPLEFQNIYNKDPFVVVYSLPGATDQIAANYGVIFNVQFSCEILGFSVSHGSISSDATLNLEKLITTVASGSGVKLLTSAISTSVSTNVVKHGALLISGTARRLLRGDRLGIVTSGTLGLVTNVVTTTIIKPLGKGHYQIHGESFI